MLNIVFKQFPMESTLNSKNDRNPSSRIEATIKLEWDPTKKRSDS